MSMCTCPRRASCHCARCHGDFNSVSAFDAHQTIGGPAGLECHDPATRGLEVVRTVDGGPVWAGSGTWSERAGRHRRHVRSGPR